MGERAELSTDSERWPTTTSVAVRLKPTESSNGLILVKIGQQWGLPAGGLDRGESLLTGLRREIREETGLDTGNVLFFNTGLYASSGYPDFDPKPHVVIFPESNLTKIGLVFDAIYHGPRLPKEGWKIHGDTKVDYAQPFALHGLMKLIELSINDETGLIYKPQFNFPQIMRWIVSPAYMRFNYVRNWLEKMYGKIGGLEFRSDDLLGGYVCKYNPPYSDIQDPEAIARSHGRKWGP